MNLGEKKIFKTNDSEKLTDFSGLPVLYRLQQLEAGAKTHRQGDEKEPGNSGELHAAKIPLSDDDRYAYKIGYGV